MRRMICGVVFLIVVATVGPAAGGLADDRSPHVFNGTDTDNPGWVVAVLSHGAYHCSGVLIDALWVLTAAHCAADADALEVMAGATRWTEGTPRTVDAVHVHPTWQGRLGVDVDLALLSLAAPIPGTVPPRFALDAALPRFGQHLTTLGWGQTYTNSPPSPILQGADVTVSSGADGTVDTDWCEPSWVSDSNYDYFCFGGGSTAWVCRGDSGGPLAVLTGNGPATLHGVVSFGSNSGCSVRETDDVAQRVATHLDWIHATADLGFVDVHVADVFAADIEWLTAENITRGCNPPANSRYCPELAVTRAQMATLLGRALDLPGAPNGGFVDVPADNPHRTDIATLAAAGITRGCDPPANDRFCPHRPVTRAEMASFLTRALGLAGANEAFVDVADTNPHAADIGALAAAGITRGCDPPTNDRFCPHVPVTRAEAAAFLHRALA